MPGRALAVTTLTARINNVKILLGAYGIVGWPVWIIYPFDVSVTAARAHGRVVAFPRPRFTLESMVAFEAFEQARLVFRRPVNHARRACRCGPPNPDPDNSRPLPTSSRVTNSSSSTVISSVTGTSRERQLKCLGGRSVTAA